MNFLRPHTRVTFPSLLTATTSDSMDHENGTSTTNSNMNGDNDMEENDDPTIDYAMFQQRVTHYIRTLTPLHLSWVNKQISFLNMFCFARVTHISISYGYHSLERSRSNLYHSRIDGTVSTSLVEDIMSLVNAMATALHTYLLDRDDKQRKDNKKEPESKLPGKNRLPMTTNEKVHMFLRGIQHIISTLEHNQTERSRQMMLWYTKDDVMEHMCATMNDSIRLSESIESFIANTIPQMIYALQQELGHDRRIRARAKVVKSRNDTTDKSASTDEAYISLQQSTNDLITLYSNHAVLLSEQISMFLVRNIKIQSSITTDFFTPSWENEWTDNELCRAMIEHYIHKYLLQCQQYLVGTHQYTESSTHDSENSAELRQQDRNNTRVYHFHKVITNTARATICLYIRCLIQNKADPMALKDNRPNLGYFQNPDRALRRMYDDIRILKKYFLKQFCQNHVTLQRIIVDEFATLELLYECLLCCWNEHLSVSTVSNTTTSPTTTTTAVTSPTSSLESFIVVIHKRCTNGNAMTTRYLVGDLFVLMSPPTLSSKSRFRFLHPSNKNSAIYQERITAIQKALQQLQPDLLLVTSHMKELNDQQISGLVPNCTNHQRSDADTVSSYHHVNCMLQSLYEERMTNGILPLLCHSLCLPHFDSADNDDELYDGTNPTELIADLFIHPIRTITRTLRR